LVIDKSSNNQTNNHDVMLIK